jgi:hypothetical protein
MKKTFLTIIIILLLICAVVEAGPNLEAGLAKIQSQRTYQEFYEMPDWTSWTASEKANHITAKVFDMEKQQASEISQLKQELARQEELNQKRSEETKQMLITIVLLLSK